MTSNPIPKTDTDPRERNKALSAELTEARTALDELEKCPSDKDDRVAQVALRRATRRLDDAKAALILNNRGLATRYANLFSGEEDYVSAAIAGLCEAVLGGSAWDPERSTLGGYSRPWIQASVREAVRSAEHRLSGHDFEARPRVIAAVAALTRAGKPITDESITAHTGLPLAQVTRIRVHDAAGCTMSLDMPLAGAGSDSNDGRSTLADVIGEDSDETDAQELDPVVLRKLLSQRIASITDLLALWRHTGIDGAPGEPLAAVAALFGESKETTRSRVNRALVILEEIYEQAAETTQLAS